MKTAVAKIKKVSRLRPALVLGSGFNRVLGEVNVAEKPVAMRFRLD